MDAPLSWNGIGSSIQSLFYRLTGNEVFKYAVENQPNKTLELYYAPQGVGGYLSGAWNEEKNRFEYVLRATDWC